MCLTITTLLAAVRRRFKELTGASSHRKDGVRWHMWFEVGNDLRLYYKEILQILQEGLGGDKLRVKLLNLLADRLDEIRLESCVVFDACLPVVLVTYFLEGGGFLSPFAFELWESIRLHGEKIN